MARHDLDTMDVAILNDSSGAGLVVIGIPDNARALFEEGRALACDISRYRDHFSRCTEVVVVSKAQFIQSLAAIDAGGAVSSLTQDPCDG